MINRLVYMYENFMLNTFGYDLAVRLEAVSYTHLTLPTSLRV